MTIAHGHGISLALAVFACLTLGCGRGAAGCRGPGPGAGDFRMDAGATAPSEVAPDAATKSGPPDAATPALARGVARGALVEVQEGDYVHIVIRDQAGSVQSFFIAPTLPAAVWEPFVTGRHHGKQVEVVWEEARVYVPEAGSEETIRRATGIRLVE